MATYEINFEVDFNDLRNCGMKSTLTLGHSGLVSRDSYYKCKRNSMCTRYKMKKLSKSSQFT